MVVNRLRQKLTFQSPPTAVDSYGQISGSWSTESVRRAEVKRLTGRELISGQQLYEAATWKVTIWYESGINYSTDWRISWGDRTLHIGSIDNVDEQNRTLEFLCSEVNDG